MREYKSFIKSLEKAKKTGAKKSIEDNLLMTLEACLEDSKNISREDYSFLKDQILYEFEIKDLPKEIQDDRFRELRETDFKHIFDIVKSLTSS